MNSCRSILFLIPDNAVWPPERDVGVVGTTASKPTDEGCFPLPKSFWSELGQADGSTSVGKLTQGLLGVVHGCGPCCGDPCQSTSVRKDEKQPKKLPSSDAHVHLSPCHFTPRRQRNRSECLQTAAAACTAIVPERDNAAAVILHALKMVLLYAVSRSATGAFESASASTVLKSHGRPRLYLDPIPSYPRRLPSPPENRACCGS